MTKDKPVLSIIIVSYNTRQITLNCLDSIFNSIPAENIYNYQIVLIDNASTDGSADILKTYAVDHPQIVFVANKENTGFGKANNQGVKLADSDYILLLNSDTVVLDNAIEDMLRYYHENQDHIGFLGAKLIEKDGHTPQPSGGPFYTLPIVFGALFLRGDYWGLTRSSPDNATRIGWVSGACIMTKKQYFEDLDGFDEGIFMYMEEIDLLLRAAKKNLHTWFYPGARFIHLGSASSGGKTYPILQVYRGFLYLYKKHYSPFELEILKCMLQLKAVTALLIGHITHNSYLIQTYGKAKELVTMD